MADDKKPSEVLGGWNRQVAEQLGQIADNTGGEGTAQAGSEKRPSDVLGGWYKEVSDLLDDIATNTEGGGEYVLPTMSPTTKGGATVGDGLTMDGNALSVDFTEVASVDALEEATAISPTGGIVSTQDGLAVSPTQSSTGAIDGALLELTAKSKPATQVTTTGKNLVFETIQWASIDSNGTIISDANFMMHVAAIAQGTTYTITTSDISGGVVYGFFASEPAAGSTSYDGVRIVSATQRNFTAPIDGYVAFRSNSGYTTTQLELGSTATPYEPYTGGAPSPSPDWPQPIVTVRGRNLIDESGSSLNSLVISTNGNEVTYTNIAHTEYIKVEANTDYYVTNGIGLGSQHSGAIYDANKQYLRALSIPGAGLQSKAINTGANAAYVIINYFMSVSPMLTLGSTPQPYVPYGHVGLERRDSQGTLLDTTPIPLPSRGWVAGLPDGTADELSVDGAGKVVWTEETDEVVLDGNTTASNIVVEGDYVSTGGGYYRINAIEKFGKSNSASMLFDKLGPISLGIRADNTGKFGYSINGTNNEYIRMRAFDTDGASMTMQMLLDWLSTNPITLLYPLATPVTEDCGYIEGWTNDFSEGCVLSIPELDDLGIKYHIDGAVSTLVHQWYEKSRSEYEQRITDLEEAVAELTAGA